MDVFASVVQKQLGKTNAVKKTNEGAKNDKNSKNARKTKKLVHDLFVQGTNDSSIVSKRSVEILYREKVDPHSKEFFQYFVKKTPRRTPVINRGYWIRMRSIQMSIMKIISQQPENQRINIINLGCGYDPLPFQILDNNELKSRNIYCIDVDYPELIGYKSQMIHMSPELVSLIGEEHEDLSAPGITIRTDNYATMGCDLTNKELYCKQLDSFKANSPSTTNIFIAEVSLAYMTPETANPIIETSSQFSNSNFLILEQLMPEGEEHPFAKRMINHFKKMEAPLQCVHTYPTISKQIERFESLGFKSVNARDLLSVWELVPNEIKLKVEQVEAFDEWEEFAFFGQHYILLHATNQEGVNVYDTMFEEIYKPLTRTQNEYHFTVQEKELPTSIQRKFHTCLQIEDDYFMTSGTNQSRLSDTISLSSATLTIDTPSFFKGRVAAQSVTIGSDAYMIGGRRMPGAGIDEVWKFSKLGDAFKWEQQTPLPTGRVKHTSLEYEGGLLIFGGSTGESFIYNALDGKDGWEDLVCKQKISLVSSCMIRAGDNIYLIGGMVYDSDGDFHFNEIVYQVKIDLQSKTVELEEVLRHKALARYGAHTALIGEKVLLIGGVGMKLYGQQDTVVEIDLQEKTVKSVPIDEKTWSLQPLFVGSDIIKGTDNCLWIVGGGAVCYGFGSVWGGAVAISTHKEPSTYLTL